MTRTPSEFGVIDDWDLPLAPDPLLELANATEQATDAFVKAVDSKTVAEAAYLRVFHTAYANSDEKTNAGRERYADGVALSERINLKAAEDGVLRAQAVMRTRLAILSAAQTHARFTQAQT